MLTNYNVGQDNASGALSNNASSAPSYPSEVPDSVREKKLDLDAFKHEVQAVINDDSIKHLDRLPILRQLKEERKLRLHYTDIRQMMHQARRVGRAAFEPITSGKKLNRAKQQWLLEGIIMSGTINMVLALAKTGKTLFILQFIAALISGQESFLGRKLSDFDRNRQVLICGPDMNEADWAQCLDTSGLLKDDELVGDRQIELLTAENGFNLDDDGIDYIVSKAQEHPGLIVLIDSYTKAMEGMGIADKDSSYGDPLSFLADAVAPHGATIIVIHHCSKGGRHLSPALAGRGSMRMSEIASWLVKMEFMKAESGDSANESKNKDSLVIGPRLISATGRGRSNELVAEMDSNGLWQRGKDLETVVAEIEAEQQKAALLDKLNDRQQKVLDYVTENWRDQDKTNVMMVTGFLFNGVHTDANRRKSQSTLDQLEAKGLLQKEKCSTDLGNVVEYWPAEASEGKEASEATDSEASRETPDDDDCLF